MTTGVRFSRPCFQRVPRQFRLAQSAQTELSMTVNVRFTNKANHKEDFERQFTATSSYENTQSLSTVQEELVTQMVKDITDQIFNATVANW